MNIFTNENAFSYYLLGAFITDGCVYKNSKNTHACQLSSCDIDWLNSIKNIIGNNLKIHKFKQNYYGIRIIRNNIAQWFISHGCFPRKTLTVQMPDIPQQYIPDFLRGCIDGDGSIGTYFNKSTKRACCIVSSSKIFLQQIQNYLSLHDIKCCLTEKKQRKTRFINNKPITQKHPCYNLQTSGKNCYKFLKLIYYSNNCFSMQRKQLLAENIINFYEQNEITDKRHIKRFNNGCKIVWVDDQKLISMINKSNIEQIAKELKIHPTSIRNRLKRRGLYDRIIKYQKVVLPPNDELINLLKMYNYTDLAKHLKIGYKTLLKKLKERKLKD